jgi:hypothetical protein
MVSRLQRPVWQNALRQAGLPEDKVQEACQKISDHYVPWQESTFPGLLGNVVAGRIANRLDLGGTNCVTDAACASTFSALHMALQELYLGDSDTVIAGGVDTMNDIFMYMCFSKTPALSRSGDVRPFSDKADGTMLGEGLGMVLLKRLADAERDGDHIYAVISGVGSSSDGRSKSVYAPVSEGQAKALVRAYEAAGYSPSTVELVEAHGTGTKAGDAAERLGDRHAALLLELVAAQTEALERRVAGDRLPEHLPALEPELTVLEAQRVQRAATHERHERIIVAERGERRVRQVDFLELRAAAQAPEHTRDRLGAFEAVVDERDGLE